LIDPPAESFYVFIDARERPAILAEQELSRKTSPIGRAFNTSLASKLRATGSQRRWA
jgi:hypothetical protein